MSDLVQQLSAKEPHYIRCIKPNEIKSSTFFDTVGVGHQVKLNNFFLIHFIFFFLFTGYKIDNKKFNNEIFFLLITQINS